MEEDKKKTGWSQHNIRCTCVMILAFHLKISPAKMFCSQCRYQIQLKSTATLFNLSFSFFVKVDTEAICSYLIMMIQICRYSFIKSCYIKFHKNLMLCSQVMKNNTQIDCLPKLKLFYCLVQLPNAVTTVASCKL